MPAVVFNPSTVLTHNEHRHDPISSIMRITILGNSGSGKSTLAQWLARRTGAPLLDLDTIAWEPGKIAVARSAEIARVNVHTFCSQHAHWVVEGCYVSLVAATFDFTPRLIFMNPGEQQCLANCRSRPWEPHKYPSAQAQDEHLAFLLSWVTEYYTRSGDTSLQEHRRCFAAYAGPKDEVIEQPLLEPPSAQLLCWLG
jgi:adenylate kinase family enzyme